MQAREQPSDALDHPVRVTAVRGALRPGDPKLLGCERELRAFLACGDPTRGFCRIHCPSCASDLLLPSAV